MSELVSLFDRAVTEFDTRVRAVADAQWSASTPNVEWDVRTLVNHVTGEDLWAPSLLDGMTIADVGDRFDGDLLGDDPKAAWVAAAAGARAAVGQEGALARTVHVSFGDIPGSDYLSQLVCDHVLHAWDLARAVGAEEQLDPELVEWVHGYLAPQAEAWRSAGAFGPRIEVPADADLQTRLLALTGRRA